MDFQERFREKAFYLGVPEDKMEETVKAIHRQALEQHRMLDLVLQWGHDCPDPGVRERVMNILRDNWGKIPTEVAQEIARELYQPTWRKEE
jgi:hypothetical protein